MDRGGPMGSMEQPLRNALDIENMSRENWFCPTWCPRWFSQASVRLSNKAFFVNMLLLAAFLLSWLIEINNMVVILCARWRLLKQQNNKGMSKITKQKKPI